MSSTEGTNTEGEDVACDVMMKIALIGDSCNLVLVPNPNA